MPRTAASVARTSLSAKRVVLKKRQYSLRFNGSSSANTDFGASTFFDSTQPFAFYIEVDASRYFNGGITAAHGVVSLKTDQGVPFVFYFNNSGNISLNMGGNTVFPVMRPTNKNQTVLKLKSGIHGICVTFDGVDRTLSSSYKLYIDGVGSPLTTGVTPTATTHNNMLGKLGTSNPGNVDIGFFATWNGGTALSATDVANLWFDNIFPSTATLTHAYYLSEGSGTSVADSVGGANGTNDTGVTWGNGFSSTRSAVSARTVVS